VLRTGGGWSGDATLELRREYVQYLLRRQSLTPPPLWFDEGAAEFLSTARVDGDRVQLGLFDPKRVRLLRDQLWIPLLRILEAQDLEGWSPGERSLFAAESWLFVHYLNFGLESGQGRKGLGLYLEQTAAGVAPETAIEAAFGMSSTALDRALQREVEKDRLDAVVVRPSEFVPGDPSPLAIEEVTVGLGELSLALNRGEQAEEWFQKALVRDPRSPRANAGLGVAQALGGEWKRATEQVGVAVSLDPRDPLNHLDAAAVALARARDTKPLPARAEFAETARGHCANASQLDATLPEAYATYGSTYLVPGEDPAKAQEALDYAHQLLPASQEIVLLLARMHARLDHATQARELVVSVLSRSHSHAIQVQAEQVLGVIEGTMARRTILKGPGAH
jgi:tetratricopeptide (TPR) repeat protein